MRRRDRKSTEGEGGGTEGVSKEEAAPFRELWSMERHRKSGAQVVFFVGKRDN